MKILHACNYHRDGGGLDNAFDATISLSEARGLDLALFTRDSKQLTGLGGKSRAFLSGIHGGSVVSEFADAIAEFEPDVIHVHELYPLISPWILPECTAAAVPVAMTCYDFRLTCPVATHFSRGEVCHRCLEHGAHWALLRNCRRSLPESLGFALRGAVAHRFGLFRKHVSHFIVPGKFSQRWLTDKLGIPSNQITLNEPAISLPERGIDDPNSGGYFGYAGRFVPEKGVEVLLEAARLARVPIKLAGDVPTHAASRADDDVSFVVPSTRDELTTFYRGCRALVVPSIWYETFGLVAAEAMSHGVPVIASRIGALQDTVRDGETGLLFASGDHRELADKLRLLWNDAELCRRLGSAARQGALNRWSDDAHFNRLMSVYCHLAPGAGAEFHRTN